MIKQTLNQWDQVECIKSVSTEKRKMCIKLSIGDKGKISNRKYREKHGVQVVDMIVSFRKSPLRNIPVTHLKKI